MIIYFSGTGNSHSVANKLSAALSDKAVPLIKLLENPEQFNLVKENRVGIVFPVYYGDVPQIVKDFFKTARLSQYTYFYAVATCGSSYGNSLYNLRELLKSRGCALRYGRVSFMIANSTATWKKNVAYDFRKLDGEGRLVQEVSNAVERKSIDYSMMRSTFLGRVASSDFVKGIGMKRFKVSVDEAACVGCGICMRICPAHNIELKNGKACVGNHCACCMACVHNCPHGGMLVNGHPIKKENQYRHPDVTLNELLIR